MGRSRPTLRGTPGVRALAAATAALALVCGISSAADQAAASEVVFVCEHGNVKSLMAASYFNQLAEQRGLRLRAISRGSAPDSNTVPQPIAAATARRRCRGERLPPCEGRGDRSRRSQCASSRSAPTCQQACEREEQRIERWDDVPPASTSYDAARTSLKTHIAELLEQLLREPPGRQPNRRHQAAGSFFASISSPS